VRIDADGDSLWSEAFGLGTESQHAECRGVHQVSDSCYVLGGRLSAAFDAMTLMKVSLCPDLAPVSDLVIQVAGDDALLSWTNVICADAYLVYFAEVSDGPYWYLGFTTDSTYVHPTVAYFASDMFYEVESYIGSLPELTASTFGIEPGSMRKADLLNLLHR